MSFDFKSLAAAVTLVGTLAGGIYVMESRYALAGRTEQQIQRLDLQYLELREATLARQVFELRALGAKRPLSDFEQAELD